MPKTATKPSAIHLGGATMGTDWSVLVDVPLTAQARTALQADLQSAVEEVDDQMSTWNPTSALMRFNAIPVGDWVDLPYHLLRVLQAGLSVSVLSEGAFELNIGDAVRAWGFGSDPIDLAAIKSASAAQRIPAIQALDLDISAGCARKLGPLALDLSGIAKGYGVDRLAETVIAHGIAHALCSIDGEVRAVGTRATGTPWTVGIDAPDSDIRGSHSVIALENAAVATSGDYRHFLTIKQTRLSHTMDPTTGAPVVDAPSSVTVLGPSCMMADAMATALMVRGIERGTSLALKLGLSALFLGRSGKNSRVGLFRSLGQVSN